MYIINMFCNDENARFFWTQNQKCIMIISSAMSNFPIVIQLEQQFVPNILYRWSLEIDK